MKKHSWIGPAILVVLSSTVACLLGESYVQHFIPQNLTASSFEYDVHTGSRLQANLDASQVYDGRRTTLKTNSLGMRQNDEIAADKPLNEKRVLFLGDSFTEGVGVEFEESFVGRFNERLRRAFPTGAVRILNSGVGGYGTENMLRYLHHYGFALKPDAVILVMGPNDIDDNLTGEFFRLLPDGKLEEYNEIAPTLLDAPAKKFVRYVPFYNYLSTHSHLFGLVRFQIAMASINLRKKRTTPSDSQLETKRQIASFGQDNTEYGFSLTKALFRQIQKECDEHSVRLFVTQVGIPVSLALTQKFLKNNRDWFGSSGIDFIDVSSGFPSDISTITIKGDGHFNSAGHQLFSELLWSKLESRLHFILERQ